MSERETLFPFFLRGRARQIVRLEAEVAKRDQALRTVRYHARQIELTAASFGLDRILEARLREIERHALDARLIADHFQKATR